MTVGTCQIVAVLETQGSDRIYEPCQLIFDKCCHFENRNTFFYNVVWISASKHVTVKLQC